MELPPLEERHVREDVVGVHRRLTDHDVVGDEQRQLVDVDQDVDVGVPGRQRGRPGMVLDPLVERPDVIGTDLLEVADQILVLERS